MRNWEKKNDVVLGELWKIYFIGKSYQNTYHWQINFILQFGSISISHFVWTFDSHFFALLLIAAIAAAKKWNWTENSEDAYEEHFGEVYSVQMYLIFSSSLELKVRKKKKKSDLLFRYFHFNVFNGFIFCAFENHFYVVYFLFVHFERNECQLYAMAFSKSKKKSWNIFEINRLQHLWYIKDEKEKNTVHCTLYASKVLNAFNCSFLPFWTQIDLLFSSCFLFLFYFFLSLSFFILIFVFAFFFIDNISFDVGMLVLMLNV